MIATAFPLMPVDAVKCCTLDLEVYLYFDSFLSSTYEMRRDANAVEGRREPNKTSVKTKPIEECLHNASE